MRQLLPSLARLAVSSLLLLCWTTTADAAVGHAPLSGLPPAAVGSDGLDGERARVTGRLLVDRQSEPPRVGVLFELDPGWHLYWRNPGATGLPTELVWQLEGATAGPIRWPAPLAFRDPATGLESYGYEGRVLLWSELDRLPVEGELEVDAVFLVCEDRCIPGQIALRRSLATAAPAPLRAAELAVFTEFEARVPAPARLQGVGVTAHFSRSVVRPGDAFEGALLITGRGWRPDADAPYFADLDAAEALSIEVSGSRPHPFEPDAFLVEFRGELEPESDRPIDTMSGVLALHDGERLRHIEFDAEVPWAPGAAPSADLGKPWLEAPLGAARLTWLELARVILLALLGGLILNGMPCVLPVLGIKVCSAAQLAQHDRSELRRHGFAYATGVLFSMAVLAGVVVALQRAGTRVGWGFQFQEPLFVAVVASVVVLFALNLFGVFEIQVSAGRLSTLATQAEGARRSFFDGLLTVVLATPCTAPFLGTAVGFAFAAGPLTIVAIFLAIGVGLAGPYTLVCMLPAWSRFVPRAGSWMLRLRAGLGFLLLATAVWLLWIFGRSAGVDGVATLLALLVALAFGSWLLGWVQTLARPRASLGTIAALALVAIAGLDTVRVKTSDASEATTARGDPACTEEHGDPPYDARAIDAALAAGQPVFVHFGADWCITCQVNEAGVLANERVRASFEQQGFAVFHGDWTRRDEAIRAELARHGRAGVPLYLVYDPRSPETPTVLPELLTVEGVLSALHEASRDLSPPRDRVELAERS